MLACAAEEPLDINIECRVPLTPQQHKWLRQPSRRVRSIAFHPEDTAASEVLASKTQLGRFPQTLQAARNVQVRDRFGDGIAAFTGLQVLSLIHSNKWPGAVPLKEQLARLPVSLQEMTINNAVGKQHFITDSLPSDILQRLTNLTRLTLCDIRCVRYGLMVDVPEQQSDAWLGR